MIRTAVVGVGNCASSLVQGIEYYTRNPEAAGLIHRRLAGYDISEIGFVAGFDVATDKIGHPLHEAIFLGTNNADRFVDEIRASTPMAMVHGAPVLDGIGRKYAERIDVDGEASWEDVEAVLDATTPDVLVNYLPVGSDEATAKWADICVRKGIAMVNSIPSFIASDPAWGARFAEAGVPVIGDDVKSQVGATILHRAIMRTFASRGTQIKSTYQLNFGGNMDFFNMLGDERLQSKLESKTSSIENESPGLTRDRIHVSPSDFVGFLGDNKVAYVRVEAESFGGLPIVVECRIDVRDSPNSAGCVVDMIRLVKKAADDGRSGPLEEESAFYCKSPPVTTIDDDASALAVAKHAG